MKSRHMSRAPLMFPRTLDQAFNTPRYASALEVPYPPLWKRILICLKGSLS